jgi:ABC-2 type transport system ATP-binding protein
MNGTESTMNVPLSSVSSHDSPIIRVSQMVKKFGDFVANNHLTFEVYKGEIFGFLGANGAGKTTAIRILCGLSFPTSGDIEVAGYNVYTDREKIKQNIGYMSQRFSLYEDLNIRENIRFYAGIYGVPESIIRQKTEQLIEELGLSSISQNLVRDIPLGWRQKVAFAVAVFHDPKIVFLDEPTGGVDPVTRRQFWEYIYQTAAKGITVFVTTHYMDEAEYCQRLSIMAEGRIEALDTPQNLKERYGVTDMNDVFVKIAR